MLQLLVPFVAFASHGAPFGCLRHWGKRLHRIPHCGDPSCFKWRLISALFRDSPDRGYIGLLYESMTSKDHHYKDLTLAHQHSCVLG